MLENKKLPRYIHALFGGRWLLHHMTNTMQGARTKQQNMQHQPTSKFTNAADVLFPFLMERTETLIQLKSPLIACLFCTLVCVPFCIFQNKDRPDDAETCVAFFQNKINDRPDCHSPPQIPGKLFQGCWKTSQSQALWHPPIQRPSGV